MTADIFGERRDDQVGTMRQGCLKKWSKERVIDNDHWTPALAPAGMDFVYGDRYPGWDGNLIIGSLVQKRLNRTIFKDGKVVGDEKLIQGIGRVRDVAVGPDGYLYALTEDTGLLVRLVPVKKIKIK